MADNVTLTDFLSSYLSTLDKIEDKVFFFKGGSDKAYIEIATLLPNINSNLKRMTKEIEENFTLLMESGFTISEMEKVTNILGELTVIPQIILDIMTSLQLQDAVKQCVEHILISIKITRDLINAIDTKNFDMQFFKTINYLKIMPQLIVAQLENIYNKMNKSISELAKKFQNIYQILLPSLTLEELLNEKSERNKMAILKEELSNLANFKKDEQLQEKLRLVVETVDKLEREVPENTNMLDVSAASTKILEQPLAEILLLNCRFLQASSTAEELLTNLYKGNQKEIDSSELLEKIIKYFSTKDELEVARGILGGVKIEETGNEGDLILF